MGTLTRAIEGKLAFFDSSPLIYYIEEHPTFGRAAAEFFGSLDRGIARGGTSVLTLLEVLTKPLRDGQQEIAREYREVLTEAIGVSVFPIHAPTCDRAAQLRAKYHWLKTPDALQIATALEHGAEILLTNDDRWKQITEISVLLIKEHAAAVP